MRLTADGPSTSCERHPAVTHKKKGGHLARPNCAQGGDLLTALVPRHIDEFVPLTLCHGHRLMSSSRDTPLEPASS